MKVIEVVNQKIAKLESLRGKHDQTVRCGVIEVIYGSQKVRGKTPTDWFLEDQIAEARNVKCRLVRDLLDEE